MRYAWSFPMIAVAGFFSLIAETPASETSYCPMVCVREIILDRQVLGWRPLDAPVHRLYPEPLISRFNRQIPSGDPKPFMGQNVVLQTFNDDEADLYKRVNPRPDRRKERKARSAWSDWLLGLCLDLIAVLAAAEISASIVVRAL
jgi:hypothetical protein